MAEAAARKAGIVALLGTILFSSPLAGAWLAGRPLGQYFEFPPRTRYIEHPGFSWPVAIAIGLFVAAAVTPFILHALDRRRAGPRNAASRPRHPFPWWGWAAGLAMAASWTLAWTRFSWMGELQGHMFTPLWLSYVLLVNAFTLRRRGHCLLTRSPRLLLALFPLSALFWWFFEWLNRFVQNWSYNAPDFTSWEYFLLATPPFATVLPAVLSTWEYLRTFAPFHHGFTSFVAIAPARPRQTAFLTLAAGIAGLAAVGIWPTIVYPLLWICPGLILVALQATAGERHVFSGVARGDWSSIVTAAVAALICGFFWEMWNYWSLLKWQYSIPYADWPELFEMPVLGYAGYLPFGVECLAIAQLAASPRSLSAEDQTSNSAVE